MFFLDELYGVKAPPGWKRLSPAEQRDMLSRKGHKRNDSGGKRSSLFSLRSTDAAITSHGTFNKRQSQVLAWNGDSSASSQRSSESLVDQRNGNERPHSRSSGKGKKLTRLNRKSDNFNSLLPQRSPNTIASAPSPVSSDAYSYSVKRSTGLAPGTKIRKRYISPPFDFVHLTHTNRDQIPDVHRLSYHELASEFEAVQVNQIPRRGLHGIQADDLRLDGYASDVPRSSTRKHALPASRPRKAPPLRPKRSDELLDEAANIPYDTIALRHARSLEAFDYAPSPVHSDAPPLPQPPRIPPPRRSSRKDWPLDHVANSLHVATSQDALSPHSPSRAGPAVSPNTLWNKFSTTGFDSPLPDRYSPRSPAVSPPGFHHSPGFQPPPIQPYADDPLLSPTYGKELERVPEEPEDVRSQRASQVMHQDSPISVIITSHTDPGIDMMAPISRSSSNRSTKSLTIAVPPSASITKAMNSIDPTALAVLDGSLQKQLPSSDDFAEVMAQCTPQKASLARMNSNASDTLGGSSHRRVAPRGTTLAESPVNNLRRQQSGRRRPGVRGPKAGPTTSFYDSEDIDWEDDVDYCYDHHMEAHCDLDWNNVSRLDVASSDDEDVPELDNSVPSVNSMQDERLHQTSQRGQNRSRHLRTSPERSSGEESVRKPTPLSSHWESPKLLAANDAAGLGVPNSEFERHSGTSERQSAESDQPPTPRDSHFTFPPRRTSISHYHHNRTQSAGGVSHFSFDKASLLLPQNYKNETTYEEAYEEMLSAYDSQSRHGTHEQKYYPFLEQSADYGMESEWADGRPKTSHGAENANPQDWGHFNQPAAARSSFESSQLLPFPSNPGHKRKSASVGAVTDFAALGLPEKSLPPMDEGIQLLPESPGLMDQGIKLLPESDDEADDDDDDSSSELKVDTIVAQLRSQLASHLSSPASPPPEAAMATDFDDLMLPSPTTRIISAPATVAAPSPRFPVPALRNLTSLPTPPLSAPPIPHSRSPSSPARFLAKPPTPPLHRKVSSESTTTRSSSYSRTTGRTDLDERDPMYLPPTPPAPLAPPKTRKRSGSSGSALSTKNQARTSFSLFPPLPTNSTTASAPPGTRRSKAVNAL
ncbi:hypothetical protein NA57DRAFT_79780 [Rhizodiscina lignyota]|uniref:CRIB domain-containing protein n=1 Tax=Rhizodiscina lignyota TaxID=1504668 RepID=A0A9P4M241_9PEZI|nr:hypothetical protein NA57DRAFT_79780 [Rhizodiscina lignyota]